MTIRRLSAGNCTSYHLLDKGIWPKGLNHLRIGGLHEFGIEYVEMKYLNEFHHSAKPVEKACSDMYVLEAEIIELNSKPTVPVGELGWMHSCRVKPLPITASVSAHYWHLVAGMSRLITVCHVMTVSPFWGRPAIIPVDIEDCPLPLQVGDVISFELDYTGLLMACQTKGVAIRFIR